jgi:hypothetical protein
LFGKRSAVGAKTLERDEHRAGDHTARVVRDRADRRIAGEPRRRRIHRKLTQGIDEIAEGHR